MIDDAFVFDCVAHVFNFDPKNAFGQAGLMFDNHLYAFHNALTPENDRHKLPPEEFLREWTPSDIRKMVYEESDTDMLVAMPLPLTDLFRDGLSPWEACADLAGRDPDRTVFWGSVNPLEGRRALDLMERQVGEFGARAFKFYNVRYDYGKPYPWRMDDPNIAFPIFEKAQELGVNLIGVHKGVPLGPQPIEHTQTWDMDGAAANFPDINFVIFHVGLPFLDETCWQLIRYPNLYASIAATINFVVRAPRMFAEILGKLLFWCGEDKIIYGSEAPLFHPQWALRAFMDFQIPEDLCAGYGYPQLTDQAKRKILGENLLTAARHRPGRGQGPGGHRELAIGAPGRRVQGRHRFLGRVDRPAKSLRARRQRFSTHPTAAKVNPGPGLPADLIQKGVICAVYQGAATFDLVHLDKAR